MYTQTHILMGAALFGRDIPKRAWIAALAGVMPDIPMLLIVAALKLYGVSDFLIYGFIYWQNWWQVTNAIAHNFWLWGGLLLISIFMRERSTNTVSAIHGWGTSIVFAASGLLHVVIDFLCHREDAHMSLWPVTRWKFISPVSYWDPSHYGRYFAIFEIFLGLALVVILLKRYANWWMYGAILLALLTYAATRAYFILL